MFELVIVVFCVAALLGLLANAALHEDGAMRTVRVSRNAADLSE